MDKLEERPDCAICGVPYKKHSGTFCPIYATYRPKTPDPADEITRLKALIDELVDGLERADELLDHPSNARGFFKALISKARSSGKAGSDA